MVYIHTQNDITTTAVFLATLYSDIFAISSVVACFNVCCMYVWISATRQGYEDGCIYPLQVSATHDAMYTA